MLNTHYIYCLLSGEYRTRFDFEEVIETLNRAIDMEEDAMMSEDSEFQQQCWDRTRELLAASEIERFVSSIPGATHPLYPWDTIRWLRRHDTQRERYQSLNTTTFVWEDDIEEDPF